MSDNTDGTAEIGSEDRHTGPVAPAPIGPSVQEGGATITSTGERAMADMIAELRLIEQARMEQPVEDTEPLWARQEEHALVLHLLDQLEHVGAALMHVGSDVADRRHNAPAFDPLDDKAMVVTALDRTLQEMAFLEDQLRVQRERTEEESRRGAAWERRVAALDAAYSQEQQAHSDLHRRYIQLEQSYLEVNERYRVLVMRDTDKERVRQPSRRVAEWEERYAALEEKHAAVVRQLDDVQRRYRALEDSHDALRRESAHLLRELASSRRNPATSMDTADSAVPSRLEVKRAFEHLCTQSILHVSEDLLHSHTISALSTYAKRERRLRVQRLLSFLCLDVQEDETHEHRLERTLALLATIVGLDLEQCEAMWGKRMADLLVEGREITHMMAASRPPGRLALCDDAAFDAQSHEAAPGTEEEGQVMYTVYPAYYVGEQVITKALVVTTAM